VKFVFFIPVFLIYYLKWPNLISFLMGIEEKIIDYKCNSKIFPERVADLDKDKVKSQKKIRKSFMNK